MKSPHTQDTTTGAGDNVAPHSRPVRHWGTDSDKTGPPARTRGVTLTYRAPPPALTRQAQCATNPRPVRQGALTACAPTGTDGDAPAAR